MKITLTSCWGNYFLFKWSPRHETKEKKTKIYEKQVNTIRLKMKMHKFSRKLLCKQRTSSVHAWTLYNNKQKMCKLLFNFSIHHYHYRRRCTTIFWHKSQQQYTHSKYNIPEAKIRKMANCIYLLLIPLSKMTFLLIKNKYYVQRLSGQNGKNVYCIY